MIKTLLVGAVVAAVLGVAGVAAAMGALTPTAQEVATEMAEQAPGAGADPLAPPAFYGSR
jgi:hypothetical protein